MQKKELLENLRGFEIPEELVQAFEKVPREEFVQEAQKKYAYENHPLPIGHGQTISQPIMIADMMRWLDLKGGQTVLEIGTGSGYQAALLKEMVGEEGSVVSIERIPELAKFAKDNLLRTGYEVVVIVGDGSLGYLEKSPYDRIVVTAGAPEVPKPLTDQLNVGGRLVVPVGTKLFQELVIIDKTEIGIKKQKSTPCVFVNLIGEHGWPG